MTDVLFNPLKSSPPVLRFALGANQGNVRLPAVKAAPTIATSLTIMRVRAVATGSVVEFGEPLMQLLGSRGGRDLFAIQAVAHPEDGRNSEWEFVEAFELFPEPANVASGLGLLALGAVGVREMRRRRAVAA